MARDENGKIDNVPSINMNDEELLAFSKNNSYLLVMRFEALTLLTERMYKQLQELDVNFVRHL